MNIGVIQMTSKYEQLIELFIAEDEQGAKDLFHEIVVEKSRDIYEGLTDEDQVEETAEVDEDTVEEDEAVEESDFDEAELGGDAADDMIDDIEADEEGLSLEDEHEGDDDMEDRVVDLEDALDELKAEFEALMGADDADDGDAMDMEPEMDMDMDMGDEEGEEEDEMEAVESEEVEETEEMVREYTEKAPAPVTSEQGDGSSGPVAGKNDMGGKAVDPTGEEKGGATPKSTVQTDASDTRGATMSKA
jgi:hypothetical protein